MTFCITCRQRRWQIERTLLENLDTVRSENDVKVVLLDYNSDDGLDEWVRESAADHIQAGRLLYVRELTATAFHMSKAKNLAHRFGTGSMLCNLDADNWIDDMADACRESDGRYIVYVGSDEMRQGTGGRIAVPRDWFHALGGYDEGFLPMSMQDLDFVDRAKAMGMRIRRHRRICRAPLPNVPEVSTPSAGDAFGDRRDLAAATGVDMTWSEMRHINDAASKRNLREGRLVANANGWGAGTVSVNFGPPVKLSPVIPGEFAALAP
jgi:hypothetical protein